MKLRRLIVEAVEAAVQKAEPPVALMVSGGLDSSTVACIADKGLPAFSGWYDYPGCDERHYAALVCSDRDWTTIEITAHDFIRDIDAVSEALGYLPCGPGAVGQYVLGRRLAQAGIRTIVTGEGGDELFGGYARQYIVAGLPRPDGYENYLLPEGYPRTLMGALAVEWDALKTLTAVDDRIAGAWGIKVVTPLLDPWVVAHVHTCSSEDRIGKKLLRDAMRGLVPDEILDRGDKVGFAAPFVAWAQEEPMRSFVKDRIGYVPNPAKPWDRGWWYDIRELDAEAVPRVIVTALLSWYDEPVELLEDGVRSLRGFCDRLVALDGAYKFTPGARASSPHKQARAIKRAAQAADIDALVAAGCIWGGQIQKRQHLFDLAADSDWLLIHDADHELQGEPEDFRHFLADLPDEVVTVAAPYWTPAVKGKKITPWHDWLTTGIDDYGNSPIYSTTLFRNLPELRVERHHWWISGLLAGERIALQGWDASAGDVGPVAKFRPGKRVETEIIQVIHHCFEKPDSILERQRAMYANRWELVTAQGMEP